jgi:hypothetical protein
MNNDSSKDSIYSDPHRPTFDADKINKAIARVARGDDLFIRDVVELLRGLQFPAFKNAILDHTKNKTTDPDIVGLIESLDGYIEFEDTYHVQKAIEENGEKYKLEHQISDETRESPNFNVRPARVGQSIKDREVATEKEERKDYPEIPPTARRDYVCDFCGTPFLTPDDLARHKRFEGSNTMDQEESTKASASPQRVGDMTGQPPEAEAVNRDMAANLANILEDLHFPATKADIKNHIGKKPPSEVWMGDITKVVNRLRENVSYDSVYEIEIDAGLVKKSGRRMSGANKKASEN